ncbi:hypothetical protein [Azospirillum sp. sgz301742]
MADSIERRTEAKGLYSAGNPFALPAGAYLEATNVVVQEPNVVEPRKGLDDYQGFNRGGSLPNLAGGAAWSFPSGDRHFEHVSLAGYRPIGFLDVTQDIVWALGNFSTGNFVALADRSTHHQAYGVKNSGYVAGDMSTQYDLYPDRDWGDAFNADWTDTGYQTLKMAQYRNGRYAVPQFTKFREAVLTTTATGVYRSEESYAPYITGVLGSPGSYTTTTVNYGGIWLNARKAGLKKPAWIRATTSYASGTWTGVVTASSKNVYTVAFRACYQYTPGAVAKAASPIGIPSGYEIPSSGIQTATPAGNFQASDAGLVIGPPSDRVVVTGNVLPKMTALTKSGSTATATFAADHGMTLGSRFSIVEANDSTWVGNYTVATAPSTTQITFTASTSLTTGTVTEWTRPMKVDVLVGDVDREAGWELKLFRTNETGVAQAQGATDPGDECFEVTDLSWTAGTAYSGGPAIQITTVDGSEGLDSLLYTNPSRETISKANDRPPLSRASALYQQYAFFANCDLPAISMHRWAPDGTSTPGNISFQIEYQGSTVTETYNAGATEDYTVTPRTFRVETGGTPSQNVQETMRSLCRVINNCSAHLRAYYVSEFEDVPGRVVFVAVGTDRDAVKIVPDTGYSDEFDPPLDTRFRPKGYPNRLFYSKFQQPEHVPALNYIDIGDATHEILALVPTDDRLLIVTNKSVFELTGVTDASFSVRPLNLTLGTVAPRTTVVLNNSAFTLTQSGFTQLAGDFESISTPIDDEVQPRLKWSNLFDVAHAVADPLRREVILWLPVDQNSTETVGYRFSAINSAWTKLDRSAGAATYMASENDLLVAFATPDLATQKLTVIRDSGTVDDYREERIATTITGVESPTVVTVNHSDDFFAAPAVGWQLEQGSAQSVVSKVEDLGSGNYRLTVEEAKDWTAAAANLYPAITTRVIPAPFVGGQAGLLKQFTEAAISLKFNSVREATFGFTTDQNRTETFVTVKNDALSFGWGKSPWGHFPWGNPEPEIDLGLRTFIPAEAQYGRSLVMSFNHARAGEKYQIIEWDISVSPKTETTVR